ncbi:aspartate/glutamate racemase family protein [Clostridium sp. KNHs205]|uniref:aspartate/glutamate racemase family protein n=1 Tax=Clostridium sp. KNHs205 TaxID=1449050 RepID=UPI00051B8C2A|nr:aspartate/glutamate racemase family protein [Clostridium sp. KNHs205]
MKIGLVYTSTTPELIDMVEQEVKKNIGEGVELLSYKDPSILAETREAGYVTATAAGKLVTLYMNAVADGAEAILNLCSSVGEVADASQDLAKYMGIPIVRIDEEMCKDAVRIAAKKAGRIGILATLPTTLEPTKNTVKRVARELGQQVTLVDGLIDAFGANQEEFKSLMLSKASEIMKETDVILLCQGSMAYCEELLAKTCNMPVVSSPRYGAIALKEALIQKGLL